MSTVKANTYQDASGGSNAILYGAASPAGSMGFRNRIINGAMVIDQRNAGAAVTADGSYPVDRWIMGATQASKLTGQQNAGSVTPPAGFSNYLGFTSSSAYSVGASDYFITQHRIEGFNTADLGFGTANAKTITISFWVRSSLTGSFGGCIANGSFNRSYPFTYTISSANTWEQKSITIAGDTTGTWVGATNGIGMILYLSLGAGSTYTGTANTWGSFYLQPTGSTSVVGTNGATWYITGVQLEVGSVATEFERRPYGTELALCQRYCYVQSSDTGANYSYAVFGTARIDDPSIGFGTVVFPVTMRIRPSLTASLSNTFYVDTLATNTSAVLLDQGSAYAATARISGSGATTNAAARFLRNASATAYLIWSAEL